MHSWHKIRRIYSWNSEDVFVFKVDLALIASACWQRFLLVTELVIDRRGLSSFIHFFCLFFWARVAFSRSTLSPSLSLLFPSVLRMRCKSIPPLTVDLYVLSWVENQAKKRPVESLWSVHGVFSLFNRLKTDSRSSFCAFFYARHIDHEDDYDERAGLMPILTKINK